MRLTSHPGSSGDAKYAIQPRLPNQYSRARKLVTRTMRRSRGQHREPIGFDQCGMERDHEKIQKFDIAKMLVSLGPNANGLWEKFTVLD
jgi:hypothetical protein